MAAPAYRFADERPANSILQTHPRPQRPSLLSIAQRLAIVASMSPRGESLRAEVLFPRSVRLTNGVISPLDVGPSRHEEARS